MDLHAAHHASPRVQELQQVPDDQDANGKDDDQNSLLAPARIGGRRLLPSFLLVPEGARAVVPVVVAAPAAFAVAVALLLLAHRAYARPPLTPILASGRPGSRPPPAARRGMPAIAGTPCGAVRSRTRHVGTA